MTLLRWNVYHRKSYRAAAPEPSSSKIVKFRDGLHEAILSNERAAPARGRQLLKFDPTFCGQ
jgi:hypothetical protein